ncbi:LamG-like jellyroll fold domain-containing protein [Dyadobacter psychrotolerans]|uniref:T9SS type A sorting domain-containing protein n=1 Tax=Dyadobacter psychrotolerans TaxID=2541721 RepID=A0A4R5DTW9_9BACT|nr:T9SS type A sorting domain-containing protein [Dyadobacter psychrotolerans]TDE17237.1 T9SS type A sorting domain-containing protein [Dyadobacter psychrotolerans]
MKKNALRISIWVLPLCFLLNLTASAQVTPNYDPQVFGNSASFYTGVEPISIDDYNTSWSYMLSGNFSIEFWVKVGPAEFATGKNWIHQPDGAISVGTVYTCGDADCTSSTTLVQFQIHITDQQQDFFTVWAPVTQYNEWFHVALVSNQSVEVEGYDPDIDTQRGEMAIYINGEKSGSRPAPDPNMVRKNTQPVKIGGDNRFFRMDELRFWNIPKLRSGILTTMNEEADIYTNGLFAYYDYNFPGTQPGTGLDRIVPNKSRGAGSPTTNSNNALTGRMTQSTYADYPVFGPDHTFVAVQSGSWNNPATWGGEGVPSYQEVVTIGTGLEDEEPFEVTMQSNADVISIVFKNGKIRTNGYTLSTSLKTFGASARSYIITDDGQASGYGNYFLQEGGGSGYTTLPIGNEDFYLPLKIRKLNSNYTFYSTSKIHTEASPQISDPAAALNVPWELTAQTYLNDGPVTPYEVIFQWNQENEGENFDRSQVYIANFHNGVWRKLGNGSPAQVISEGVYAILCQTTEFSEFTASSSPSALPVSLISFKAKQESETVQLSWSTSSELNASGFHVQRSQDGKNWNTAGFVKAAGHSNTVQQYQFTDNLSSFLPNENRIYYRLKQIDLDKTYAYSRIESVVLDRTTLANSLYTYPNPVSDRLFVKTELVLTASKAEVFSPAGKLLKEWSVTPAGLDVSSFPPGIYPVLLNMKDGSKKSFKVLIAR